MGTGIKDKLREILIVRPKRNRNKNMDFTIIANDCAGGVICHELGCRFNSPTINLYMDAPDYIKFINDIHYYIDQPMIEVNNSGRDYPVAMLGDIRLYLVHYRSVEEAQKKWDIRKKRINWNNIFYMMSDRNGCTNAEARAFDDFHADKKLFYAHKKNWGDKPVECLALVKGMEKRDCVPETMLFTNKWTLKKPIDSYNYVRWLNE
jgi:uncharacterized protein (DUF1919 family)